MADKAIVHIGENSPEQVAYKLFQVIADIEKKSLSGADQADIRSGWGKADREWVLKTYGACISTVRQGWYEP